MTQSGSAFSKRPRTRLGWWAVGLAAMYMLMNIINSGVFMYLPEDVSWRQTILPFYGIFMIFIGLAALAAGLIAILRNHEQSWLVWLSLLLGVSALMLILGEFLLPH